MSAPRAKRIGLFALIAILGLVVVGSLPPSPPPGGQGQGNGQENGLAPVECLAAATEGGALALGWQADVGSVEVGKLADMVLLEANPLTDIRNVRKIAAVVSQVRTLGGGIPALPDRRPRRWVQAAPRKAMPWIRSIARVNW